MKLTLPGATIAERLIGSMGAALCVTLTFVVCAQLPLARADLPIIVAPLGASAVLVFAVPASPLAQPWPVVGGNILSTLLGVTMVRVVPDVAIAAGLAVGSAIVLMSLLRCLHPPGGAAALTAVIGGQDVHAAGYGFAFLPVGLNSLALVALAMVFHGMTARSYPHVALPPVSPAPLDAEDIDAALDAMHESFDISRADLDALLAAAEANAQRRRGG